MLHERDNKQFLIVYTSSSEIPTKYIFEHSLNIVNKTEFTSTVIPYLPWIFLFRFKCQPKKISTVKIHEDIFKLN